MARQKPKVDEVINAGDFDTFESYIDAVLSQEGLKSKFDEIQRLIEVEPEIAPSVIVVNSVGWKHYVSMQSTDIVRVSGAKFCDIPLIVDRSQSEPVTLKFS